MDLILVVALTAPVLPYTPPPSSLRSLSKVSLLYNHDRLILFLVLPLVKAGQRRCFADTSSRGVEAKYGNPQNRELLSKIFGALHDTPSQDKKQGMNTTSVAGYPVFICWGRWGGSEVNQSGNNKGFIFLPYLQTGQMPLSRYSNPN